MQKYSVILREGYFLDFNYTMLFILINHLGYYVGRLLGLLNLVLTLNLRLWHSPLLNMNKKTQKFVSI